MMSKIPVLHSSLFTFTKDTGTFATEMSTIEKQLRGAVSFYILSARTGDRRLFLFSNTEHTGVGSDREIAAWRFFCPGEGLNAVAFNT